MLSDLLRVEDLIDIDYDGWSTEADVEWSPLAAHGEYRQDARLGDGDLPELRYEIVTVKLPFLYGLCKRDFIQWWSGTTISCPWSIGRSTSP